MAAKEPPWSSIDISELARRRAHRLGAERAGEAPATPLTGMYEATAFSGGGIGTVVGPTYAPDFRWVLVAENRVALCFDDTWTVYWVDRVPQMFDQAGLLFWRDSDTGDRERKGMLLRGTDPSRYR